MADRYVQSKGYEYQYCSDGILQDGKRLWALVSARLLDELTDEPPVTNIKIKAAMQGVGTRVVGDGLVGVIGNPERVFSPIDLQSNSHDLSVTFLAKGYVTVTKSAQIGPISGFPDNIIETDLPVSLGNFLLHREPIKIRGRVMVKGASLQPAAGAEVSIQEIFRKVPSAKTTVTPDPYHPISLSNRLYASRLAVTTKIREVSITLTPDPEKRVTKFGAHGSLQIWLSNTVGLSIGDYLQIDNGDPEKQEMIQIDSITNLGLDASPGRVTLVFPLAQSHRIDAIVNKVKPQILGVDNSLGVEAIQGDMCLLLDSLNGLSDEIWVEIHDGILPNEYHSIQLYSVKSDADGYYRLPPLSRVGQLNLD